MDESEARRLVTTYSHLILRLSYTYLKSTHEAEDICQNVFLKYMDSNIEFLDEDHEKAWIIRTTINTCKNVLKSAYRKKVVITDEISADTPTAGGRIPYLQRHKASGYFSKTTINTPEDEPYTEVREAVSLLNKNYRIAIYLFYFEEYSTKEIAAIMGKSENSVSLYLSRGRRKLREILKDYVKEQEAYYEQSLEK